MYLKWETLGCIQDEWRSSLYILGNTTHISETSLNIIAPRFMSLDLRSIFRDNLHLTSPSVMFHHLYWLNRTVIRWCILPNQTYKPESLVENFRLLCVSHHKWISKIRYSCPYIRHYDTLSTHHCIFFIKFWHITKRMFSLTSSLPIYRPPSYEHIFLIETAYVLDN
jgi:hypothetical protein